MNDSVMQPVIESAKVIKQGLEKGEIIYGRGIFQGTAIIKLIC